MSPRSHTSSQKIPSRGKRAGLRCGSRNFRASAGRSRIRGIALAIVLPLLVLLTLLVTAFLSRAMLERKIAASSTAQMRTELLGRSALDWITSDLVSEIRAGSNEVSPGVLEARSARTGVPQRVGTADTLPNLIKTSAATGAFFGGPDYTPSLTPLSIAVASGTGDADLNGVKINPARWNKPQLMSSLASFTPPDWVLVTRKGPRAFTAYDPRMADRQDASNDDHVVGRYAFAIYDEGGLLDANVAGAPSAVSAEDRAKRGPSALADLTQIGLDQSQINALVGWRNRLTLGASGSFPSYVLGADAPQKYLEYVMNAPGGFIIPPYDATGKRSDQRFLSRLDLLDFQKNNPTLLPVGSLPYLTTFSRSLSRPSWRPLQNAQDLQTAADSRGVTTNGPANAYAYRDNATLVDAQGIPTAANPDFRLLRVLAAFMRVDGTTAIVGEPLLKRRFPLSRLAWVGFDGPANGVTADRVKKAFGLTWDPVKEIWIYTSPDEITARATIKTLNEIANPIVGLPREPDFFELLKAGILDGSVGLGTDLPTVSDVMEMDKSKERQLIQIGANLIDQYDADNYPTVIQFIWPNSQTDYDEVAGIESLPYFAGMTPMVFRREGAATGDEVEKFIHMYLVPRFWNPHQVSGTGTPTAGPAEIRVIAKTGLSGFTVENYRRSRWKITEETIDYSQVPQWVSVTQTNFSLFDNPQVLNSSNSNASSASGELRLSASGKVTQAADFNGIYAGKVNVYDAPFELPTASAYWSYWINELLDGNGHGFGLEIQYKNSGGAWITYQYFPSIAMAVNTSTNGIAGRYVQNNDAYNWNRYQYPNIANIDPRGARFGLTSYDRGTSIDDSLKNSIYPSGTGGGRKADSYRLNNGVVPGYHARTNKNPPMPSVPPENQFFYPLGWTSNGAGSVSRAPYGNDLANTRCQSFIADNLVNTFSAAAGPAGSVMYYLDPDLIRRGGDATLPSLVNTSNPMVNPMASTRSGGTGKMTDRPVILNRPFRSVGDVGYAFRDLPWKTLDLNTARSADAGLLDLFEVSESDTEVVAGRVHLNTRQAPVLQALLAGALKDEIDSGKLSITPTDSEAIANGIIAATSASPLRNVAELATSIMPGVSTALKEPVKTRKEAVVRSLAAGGTASEWNLLIDVIVQSGRYIKKSQDFNGFLAEGEKRYWLHLAIDRQTGKIFDQQLEAVYE